MQTLLEALICAFLTIKVFRKKLPWNSPMDCLTDPSLAPMDKYFRRCLEAKRVKYEKVVHAAAFDQIKDEEFQNTTVMEAAEVLTTEFAFTVMDQITLFRKGRTPTDGWYRRFLDNLKDVFWNALIMRGQFEASMDNFIIQWRWPKEPFDIDTMTTPSGHYSNKGAPVQYTILPAIVRHDYGSKGPGITAFRAMVSLNSKDIVGISKRG
ncbi:hypothetical protein CLAFUW4_14118 [Fulvia fulva]|uniref:Uncharacterized protein n=1 Tax=Passalora fulva TaxID=5499 RepID=A0A9Q8PLE4_PASFU|nr:uncharacterized protein CLAFUR5_13952 [Fulvia fulva]KAK4610623.1 hypothetical protein CLAFUR4_14121 [Fulvia fulva]KAK4611019.1 hypothetical protein CLAFUR0_14125 [Fulvia fulva]UJO24575.1 hypothetical protein CLAFUR5_13952 [Fulvia fulva]WPV21877.1 hypothetical protein CLAFUW4_14118 [Fulvia fulva]WPV36717.1 hypothetical protein CLAFUW7_14129 [Fulvia fulva]